LAIPANFTPSISAILLINHISIVKERIIPSAIPSQAPNIALLMLIISCGIIIPKERSLLKLFVSILPISDLTIF